MNYLGNDRNKESKELCNKHGDRNGCGNTKNIVVMVDIDDIGDDEEEDGNLCRILKV